MEKRLSILFVILLISFSGANAQEYIGYEGKVSVAVVKNRHRGPEVIAGEGLNDVLMANNSVLKKINTVELSPAEEKECL